MCHGLLIEELRGEYIGSKDAGIGGSELRWMERATNFTIGNGCLADTGEGTALGVHSGMRTTLEVLGKGIGGAQKRRKMVAHESVEHRMLGSTRPVRRHAAGRHAEST